MNETDKKQLKFMNNIIQQREKTLIELKLMRDLYLDLVKVEDETYMHGDKDE